MTGRRTSESIAVVLMLVFLASASVVAQQGTAWSAGITSNGELVESAIHTVTVVIGVDAVSSAQDMPPKPPEYTTWLSAFRPPTFDEPYGVDIRAFGEPSYLWPLLLDPNGDGSPFTPRTSILNWDPTEFDPSGEYSLVEIGQDGGPGAVLIADMTDVGSTSYPVTGTQDVFLGIFYTPGSPCDDDNEAPIIVIGPGPRTYACPNDVPACSSGSIAADDNCEGAIAVACSDVENGSIITRTWVATDAAGNQSEPWVQVITIQDMVSPVIVSGPGPMTYDCISEVPACEPGEVEAEDNCEGTITVVCSDAENGSTIIRAWIATDASGNQSIPWVQEIMIQDQIPPEIVSGPGPMTYGCISEVPPCDAGEVVAEDNCEGTVTVDCFDEQNGSTIIRAWIATDASGNQSARWIQEITIQDQVSPVIVSGPDAATYDCITEVPPCDEGAVVAEDNCEGPVTVDCFDEQNGSTIFRAWIATDASGNRSERWGQVITVLATEVPILTCPDPIYATIVQGEQVSVSLGDLGCDAQLVGGVGTFVNGTLTFEAPTSGTYTFGLFCTNECGDAGCNVIVNVTVDMPAGPDTVLVVSASSIPGMSVDVPVLFTNSCDLAGLGLSLNWTGDFNLDSVSFEGSAIDYVASKVVGVNNDANDVTITADVANQTLVPTGSGQLLATLHFTLLCEIEEGDYDFSLGAYPPLEPADVYFISDCGGGTGTVFPNFVPGSIGVATASSFVCGYVVDPFDNPIEGATVELWEDYPFTMSLATTMSSAIGGFVFDEITVVPFDLYAYKDGYYPGTVEDIGEKHARIVLRPLPELLTNRPSSFVDYYCPDSSSTLLGGPLPIGAVVEAYTQNDLLVGQEYVARSGIYGFMPVYAASDPTADDGARAGDRIRFTINGMPAIASGNTIYPDISVYSRMEVCLEVRGTVEKVCNLVDGWNLISWNVNTETDDILTILAPVMNYVDVVLGYEQGGLTFDPDLQEFSTLWDVDHLSGYWVRIEGAGDIDLAISGLPVPWSTPIALTAGWNLVSYLPEVSLPVETALLSVVDVVDFAYGFPMGNIEIWEPGGAFNMLSSFDPCNGYWIKTNADAWLTYDYGVPSTAAPRSVGRELTLNTSIAKNSWVNLYSKSLTLDEQVVATGTVVNAHAVKNDDVVGTFTLNIDGQFGFMPVYAGGSEETVAGIQAGDEFYLTVNDTKTDEVFTWTNNGDRIEVAALSTAGSSGEVLPENYSLAQNYPNPFNPATEIKFDIPVAADVRLEIFNVTGQRVEVLANGPMVAGQHAIQWDASKYASGMYMYRLTANNFVDTKKMVLLK